MSDEQRPNLTAEDIRDALILLRERGLIESVDSDETNMTVRITPALEDQLLQGIVAGETPQETTARISGEIFGDDDDS